MDLIRQADGKHVHAFTWPLLLRSDGKKFGKSEDGAVWLAADRTSPYQFFQYWMNVADADIERFLLQLTLLPVAECVAIAAAHAEAPHKRAGQRRLAREVTAIVHGPEATAAAQEASAILFGGSPAGASAQALEFLATEVPTAPFAAGVTLAATLAATPLASSLSDARRTIAQGAASVNGEVVAEDRPLTEATCCTTAGSCCARESGTTCCSTPRPANGPFLYSFWFIQNECVFHVPGSRP